MPFSRSSLAGSGYVVLNAIRVLNIIGLLAAVTASVVMLVKTQTNSSFFFFDAVTNVIAAFSAIYLLVSELTIFQSYFASSMPLLSSQHGFTALSLALFVLGVDLLGKLNHENDSQAVLGLSFWRIVLSAGTICFVLSFVNILANYLFRDTLNGVTARQIRSHGADEAARMAASPPTQQKPWRAHAPPSLHSPDASPSPRIPNRLSALAARHLPPRLLLSTSPPPDPVLPSYQACTSPPPPRPASPSSVYSRPATASRPRFHHPFARRPPRDEPRKMDISAPLNVNPQFAHLVRRPDSALHPSRGEGGMI